jgi:hypothetical protein
MKKFGHIALLLCLLPMAGCKKSRSVEQEVELWNSQLPKVVNEKFRLGKIEYSDHMMHETITLLGWQIIRTDKIEGAEKELVHNYCYGEMKKMAEDNIGIEFTLQTEPHSLDLHIDSITFSVSPDQCK